MNRNEIDLNNPDSFNAGFPHHWFDWMRKEEPVFWQEVPDGVGFWNITKYEDVKSISKQPNLFSSWLGGTNIFDLEEEIDLAGVRSMMVNMDPPEHVKYRRLVSKNFTPRSIAMSESHVKDLAKRIIDDIAARGECDFINDVAAILPMKTICEMLGVPDEDHHLMFDLSNRLIGFDDPEYQSSFEDGRVAAAEVCMYANKLAEMVKGCPMNNLASAIYHGQVDGEKLDEMSFGYFILLLTIAGNETTRTMTAHGMRLLFEHPEQRQKLVDNPELIPSGVEEILRYNPPVMHFRRTASEDTEVRGQKIRKGEKLIMWYPSANRDEEVFENANEFRVDRTPNEHLAFGIGEHFCLGASLARLQLNCIFTELLGRLPDMEPAGGVSMLRSNFIDGIKEMPVRFTPEQAA